MSVKKHRLVVAIIMILTVFYANSSVYAATFAEKGRMGENVIWSLDDDEVLTIYGQGSTFNYKDPWTDHLWSAVDTEKGQLYPKKLIVEDGVTRIGDLAFAELNELISAQIANSVTELGEAVFWDCDRLSMVELSNNITAIPDATFIHCASLTTVTIPNSVTKIGEYAFYDCDKLTDIYYSGNKEQWDKIKVDNTDNANSRLWAATIHYNDDSISDIPSSWAKAEVESAISLGIVPEELQKNYKKPISRENAAKMLVGLIEESMGQSIDEILIEEGAEINKNAFSDTTDTNVLAANALGIINGIGNGKFNPNGTLTRAQVAAMINRVAKVVGIDTEGFTHNFTDVSNHWVNPELGWPVEANIITGVGNNKFDPDANLTTEQTILIVYRALTALK